MSISGVLLQEVVVGLVQLVLAVLGLQLFMGKMHKCSAAVCCSAPGVCKVSKALHNVASIAGDARFYLQQDAGMWPEAEVARLQEAIDGLQAGAAKHEADVAEAEAKLAQVG